MKLLTNNFDKINWKYLSYNKNPLSIKLLKDNPDKIDWYAISKNPNAIELLLENSDKIDWYAISKNPAIFTYPYKEIKNNFELLGQEIIEKSLHPKRMLRLMDLYSQDEIYNCYFE